MLTDYAAIVARSQSEVAFIRKVSMESEEQFRAECERVAGILAPQVPADSYLSCVYDDVQGRTRFLTEFRKTGDSAVFIRDGGAPQAL